jgi:hypothetical protein
MAQKKRRITISFEIEVSEELVEKKLDELAQEMVGPLKKMGINSNIEELKKTFGTQIGNIAIKSLHDVTVGREAASGYEGKIWEKATC